MIPIVNPDGFNASREAGELYMRGGGASDDADGDGTVTDPEFILAAAAHPNEYRRKNCRFPVGDGRQLHAARHRASSARASTRTATTARSGAARART